MIDPKTSTVKEWLEAWDRGESVPTIEMGGMGSDYEQALQICAFECVRFALANEEEFRRVIAIEDEDERQAEWRKWNEKIDAFLFAGPCKNLGLSGAQVSSAKNITSVVMLGGLIKMEDEEIKDRRILIKSLTYEPVRIQR